MEYFVIVIPDVPVVPKAVRILCRRGSMGVDVVCFSELPAQ
jgi:hypothetical protein